MQGPEFVYSMPLVTYLPSLYSDVIMFFRSGRVDQKFKEIQKDLGFVMTKNKKLLKYFKHFTEYKNYFPFHPNLKKSLSSVT